jgi:hypothetical protein
MSTMLWRPVGWQKQQDCFSAAAHLVLGIELDFVTSFNIGKVIDAVSSQINTVFWLVWT